jgi:glycosyltransferase involved in cell wall biosynthesis
VATSRGGALPEVLVEASLSFDADDVDEQRLVLETLLTATSVRQRLMALGRARAKRFSWERCADETLAVYRSLADDPAHGGAPSRSCPSPTLGS